MACRSATRVVVRYRLPAGSVPPLTDVIGHLVAVGPTLSVRTKRGDVVDIAADDVVAIKALAAAPVRTGDIRNLEHAAALGVARHRAAVARAAGCCASATEAPAVRIRLCRLMFDGGADADAIVDWYAARGVAAAGWPRRTGCSAFHLAYRPTPKTW